MTAVAMVVMATTVEEEEVAITEAATAAALIGTTETFRTRITRATAAAPTTAMMLVSTY